MCLKLIFHNLICDVRPKVARGIHSSPIINPYADPKPCAPDCAGKERIPPYFRCLKHKCCMNSATYVDTSCRSRCSPAEITLYHVYSQWGGATPEQQWEALPAIDSYIPKLRVAIPMSPAFRVWRAELLTKGGQVQEVLDLMDMVETRLAEELHHQQNDHRICVELERNWERLRRYETEQRPAVCRNGEKITRFWEKLGKLGDLLKTLESEYIALQTPPAGVVDFTGLITSLSPAVQNQRYMKSYRANQGEQWSTEDLKDTVHQMAVFRF